MAQDWSRFEVEAAVEDYLDMLRLELTGEKYNKTQHRRALMAQLNHRTDSSVELKHQNISAVLIEMGIPCIDGYKPRFNYQRTLLPSVIASQLKARPALQALFAQDSQATPDVPTVQDFLTAMEAPPAPEMRKAPPGVAESPALYNPAGINYLELEARNRSLGEAGEHFVINYERARLIHAGKDTLADRIEHVSATVGPSAGFDIRSFELSGTDRFIEVKTTKYGKNTPFFVSPNELRFSKDNAAHYFLYRIFRFHVAPRVFALQGHLGASCVLTPSEFVSRPI